MDSYIKLICIDTLNHNDITLYEMYEGLPSYDNIICCNNPIYGFKECQSCGNTNFFRNGWYIKMERATIIEYDFTMRNYFPLKCFMPLSEWRDMQINDILYE